LVSDVEGPLEIIAGGQLGWVFRSEDIQDLSSKIIDMIALSRRPGFADQMRARVEQAKTRFDIKLTARKYLDEYARLALEAGTARLKA
jgi:glycosyltransferase involved in cell wall biosynthesis